MTPEPDPPSFIVLPAEYDGPSAAGVGEPDPARRLPPQLTGLAHRRWVRWAAAALACAVAGAFMVVALTSERKAVRATPTAPATQPPQLRTGPVAPQQPWPTGPGVCGTQRYLPKVAATELRASTGVRVQVGGQSVHTADIDARSLTAVPGLNLPDGQFVSQLAPGADASYALVQPCKSTDASSVRRITRDSSSLVLASSQHIDSLLADGRGGVWAVEVPGIGVDEPITLVQLPGPGVVRLPAGLSPVAVWGNQLIGLTAGPGERRSPSSGTLVRYDLASRRLDGSLGRASSLTVDAGTLLWISQPCRLTARCALHRYDLATGQTTVRDYELPVETSIVGGVLNPARSQLAFPLARIYEGQRVDFDGFGPPFDVAVLHLDTGLLEKVGGLALPATGMPGLGFSARGDWLVIALNQGRSTELLLWRSGQTRPLRPDLRVDAPALEAPPVIAVSS